MFLFTLISPQSNKSLRIRLVIVLCAKKPHCCLQTMLLLLTRTAMCINPKLKVVFNKSLLLFEELLLKIREVRKYWETDGRMFGFGLDDEKDRINL